MRERGTLTPDAAECWRLSQRTFLMIGPTGRAIYFGERYFMHYRPEWIVCRPHDLPDFVLDLDELSEQQVQAWLRGFAATDRLHPSFEDSPYADYDHYARECLMPLPEGDTGSSGDDHTPHAPAPVPAPTVRARASRSRASAAASSASRPRSSVRAPGSAGPAIHTVHIPDRVVTVPLGDSYTDLLPPAVSHVRGVPTPEVFRPLSATEVDDMLITIASFRGMVMSGAQREARLSADLASSAEQIAALRTEVAHYRQREVTLMEEAVSSRHALDLSRGETAFYTSQFMRVSGELEAYRQQASDAVPNEGAVGAFQTLLSGVGVDPSDIGVAPESSSGVRRQRQEDERRHLDP